MAGIAPPNLRLGALNASSAFTPPSDPWENVEIIIDGLPPDAPRLNDNSKDGVRRTVLEGGAILFEIGTPQEFAEEAAEEHDVNLADFIDSSELARIADDLLLGIQEDEDSREEWLTNRARGMDLLGVKLEEARARVATGSTECMSKVRHPVLLEATLRSQAIAAGELLPAAGPVKVRVDGKETAAEDELATELQADLNHYLTVVDEAYLDDTDRLLLYTVFGGSGFKKVYNCPIRRRPVSESVDAKDLIIGNGAKSLTSSPRVTHQIMMRPSTLRRMQIVGAYRDVRVEAYPTPEPNAVDRKIDQISGVRSNTSPAHPEDADYTIYECYCELDINNFGHQIDGEETGLKVPYVVTLEKDSRQVLAIRRNWEEGDDLCLPRIPFVKYSYVPGFGFYDLGLLNILGNPESALTAAWRIMLDNGMFANFPGGIIEKQAMRSHPDNNLRAAPGEFVPVETGDKKIGDIAMPLPYKDTSVAFATFIKGMEETTSRVGGIADISVGDGRQDAPVGTTMALIEQAVVMLSEVHKRLHRAQTREFILLVECFRKDPESFIRSMRGQDCQGSWDIDKFSRALNSCNVVPAADPNTPSKIHRIMRSVALKQLSASSPGMYNVREIDTDIMKSIGISNPERYFAAPMAPAAQPPDPRNIKTFVDANLKGSEMQLKAQIEREKLADNAAERETKKQLGVLDLAQTLVVHPTQEQMARTMMSDYTPEAQVQVTRQQQP